jgi:predicted peroxiredoxin
MRNDKIRYAISTFVVVGILLVSATTLQSTTQKSVFAQGQTSDHGSMTMNMTTNPASKTHSFGKGTPVLVHISSGDNASSYEVHSAQMGVDHALSMLRNGKDVSILLDVNGVNLAAKNVTGPLEPMGEMLQIFLNEGGRVIACDHCVSMAGMVVEDLLPGVEIDAHPDMPKMQRITDQGAAILDY